jgi:hypothetical protein
MKYKFAKTMFVAMLATTSIASIAAKSEQAKFEYTSEAIVEKGTVTFSECFDEKKKNCKKKVSKITKLIKKLEASVKSGKKYVKNKAKFNQDMLVALGKSSPESMQGQKGAFYLVKIDNETSFMLSEKDANSKNFKSIYKLKENQIKRQETLIKLLKDPVKNKKELESRKFLRLYN